jgi:hypothetical protein
VSLLLLPSGLVKQFLSGAKLMLSDKNYYYTADRDMAKLVYSFLIVFSPLMANVISNSFSHLISYKRI